jgi:hypothetical protein
VFDHKVRRGPSYWHKLGHFNTKSRGPLHRAHVDQSYNGAVIRLRESFPDIADQLMARRWQIINVSQSRLNLPSLLTAAAFLLTGLPALAAHQTNSERPSRASRCLHRFRGRPRGGDDRLP